MGPHGGRMRGVLLWRRWYAWLVFGKRASDDARMQQATDKVRTDHFDHAQPPVPALFWVFSPERQILDVPPHTLLPGCTGIGRDDGTGQRISLPGERGISRQHAVFESVPHSQTLTLRDTSTHHSTWVNGQRLLPDKPTPLAHNDVLRLGDSIFVLSITPSPSLPAALEEHSPPQLIGRSPLIVQLRRELMQLAKAEQPVPVLLLGEPGTGKERAARTFHEASGRKTFLAQDCGALPLPESTLFGHVKGAFTGASQDREGLFRAATGGTLFLDEIGNLSLDVQQKLLRVLAERRNYRLGEEEKQGQAIDVLVIAATNRPLVQDMRAGFFRLDLFRRLSGVVLRLPPLRTRREDILLLLKEAPSAPGIKPQQLPKLNTSGVELLLLHDWPGNVGDLLNVRGHLCSLGFDDKLRQRLTDSPAAHHAIAQATRDAASDTKQKEPRPDAARMEELLREHDGKLRSIERATGWSRRTLGDWVKKFKLEHLREDGEEKQSDQAMQSNRGLMDPRRLAANPPLMSHDGGPFEGDSDV